MLRFTDKYCPSIWKMANDPAALGLPSRDALKRSGFSACFCLLKCLCSCSIDRNTDSQIVCTAESLWHSRIFPEVKTDTSISNICKISMSIFPCVSQKVP